MKTTEQKVTKRKRTKRRRKGHYHRGEYTSKKTGQVCKYRSGWEEKYMTYLDSHDQVISWSYESLSIDYVSNKKTGKTRRYIPDFRIEYLDGRTELVEIKPLRKVNKPTVQKKLLAAQAWCNDHGISLKIITEIELKNLGLL